MIKGAFVGFGNIAEHGHLPAYQELGIDIIAAVDNCSTRRNIARGYGLKGYSTIRSLVENEKIDFIDLCTPPNYRAKAFDIAVEYGIDLICEKPIAHMSDFQKIKKITNNSNVFFFPVHNWKYAPQYQKLKDVINGNCNIQMNILRTSFGRGNSDWKPDWRIDYTISGGGILMDHGYHSIYLAMYLMDEKFKSTNLKKISYFNNSNIENSISFELLFSQNRSTIINLDWCADRREIQNVINTNNNNVELLENKITVGKKIYNFDHSLSQESIHVRWYLGVISEFVEKRNSFDKKFFLEATHVLDGIKKLYEQAEKWR